jgi:coproporphyrinogen III oxidase-like Fe-S oxidoreductase
VRTKNWANTQLYCERIEQGKRAVASSEELGPLERAGETAAFGLRMVAGWPFEQFRQVTGHDLRQGWASDMHSLSQKGWAQLTKEGFQLTTRGLRFADAAAEMFLR